MSVYQKIEQAIISWSIDGTRTAGNLTRELLSLIQQKTAPAFKEKVISLLSRITMDMLGNKTFHFKIEEDKKGGNRLYIQLEYNTPCTKTGEHLIWRGRKWYLSEHMTDNEIIFTAYSAYEMVLKHEMMETFKMDGIILVNPHVDYNELLKISNNEVIRK